MARAPRLPHSCRPRHRRHGVVTIRDRIRRLPNSLLLYVTFALGVGAAIVATLPYDVAATSALPQNQIDFLATSTTESTPPTAPSGADTSLPGTTTTSIHTGLETQPRVNDGILECGPPLFELAVPGKDRRVAKNVDCLDGARWRASVATTGAAIALLVGLVGRRVRLKRYERIAKEERRRLLRLRAPPDDPA